MTMPKFEPVAWNHELEDSAFNRMLTQGFEAGTALFTLAQLTEAYEAGKRDTVPEGLANFACYLIDHCEGETISEEFIQRALSQALKLPQYAAAPKGE